MQAREQVNKKIASHACTIISVISPAEETQRIEWTFGSVAYVSIPIHVRRVRIGRNRILPCSCWRMARPETFSVGQRTYRTIFQQLFSLFISERRHTLATHLEHFTRFFLRGDYSRTFRNGMHHWLFAIHVLACFHCVDRNLLVPVIRSSDDHCIDIFPVQQFLVAACGENDGT